MPTPCFRLHHRMSNRVYRRLLRLPNRASYLRAKSRRFRPKNFCLMFLNIACFPSTRERAPELMVHNEQGYRSTERPQPEGLPDISRRVSVNDTSRAPAKTTAPRRRTRPSRLSYPAGPRSESLASLRGAGRIVCPRTGGIVAALLDPRLMSGNPSGCSPITCERGTHTLRSPLPRLRGAEVPSPWRISLRGLPAACCVGSRASPTQARQSVGPVPDVGPLRCDADYNSALR
jgi:hypothetical protein